MAQVKCLITSNAAHGAINLDVNSIDKLGNTTLHYIMGCYDFDPCSNRDKVLEILDVGGNPNLTNKEGYSPLHIACKNKQIEAIKFCIQLNQAYKASKQKEPFDFMLRAKHNYTLLHLACLNAFDKFFDLYMKSEYLVSRISFLDRDKYYRRPMDLVLYNSQYFKRLKRIEKKYCNWRLNNKKQEKCQTKAFELHNSDDSEGNINDYPDETSPMINKRNSVNSLAISGTGKQSFTTKNFEYHVTSKSFIKQKSEVHDTLFSQECISFREVLKSKRSK